MIDAKYKPSYVHFINHEDIRQVSGYSRLISIRKEAKVSTGKMLDCVIIYPDLQSGVDSIASLHEFPIKEYEKVFKIGVKLPLISQVCN